MAATESVVAAAPAPQRPGAFDRFKTFARARRHDLPGVIGLAGVALVETVSTQFFAATDLINAKGISVLTDGTVRPQFDVGLAGVFLPFVIVAWLFGKRRPIRIMFGIAVFVALLNLVTTTINVLGTINLHTGNVGAATLLADAALLWMWNVVIFAIWYWSTDAGGPDVRGTPAAKRPDFDFPQQRSEIRGWEGWVPGFHDYLHAAFVISLGFHAGVAEVLSARAKYVNMFQAAVSVTILVVLVAKAIATFPPGG
jgi:hypothetical protein